MAEGTAIVAGGLGYVGRAITTALLNQGHHVIVLGRRNAGDEDVTEGMRSLHRTYGPAVEYVECDTSEPASVRAVTVSVRDLTVGVYAAGVTYPGPALPVEPDEIEDMVRANGLGPVYFAAACIEAMTGPGSITNVGSWADGTINLRDVHYGASKAYARVAYDGLALGVAPRGVRLNTVRVGVLDGGMAARHAGASEEYARMIRRIPAGRLGTAEEVANVVKFLNSHKYITGATIDMTGGAHLGMRDDVPDERHAAHRAGEVA